MQYQSYTCIIKSGLLKEFPRFPSDQQVAIAEFKFTFEQHGLGDFSKYKGKITPSWKTLDENSDKYNYAFSNNLWHYHLGLPKYNKSPFGDYYTSDWVLHFQWKIGSNKSYLVDVYNHYNSSKEFYLPSENYLK